MHGCESKKLSPSVHQARRERDVQATRSSPDRRVPYKKVAVSIVWATPLLGGERATTGKRARHFCNQRFRSSDLRKSGKFPILSGSQENVSNRFVAQSVIGICSGTDVSGDRFTFCGNVLSNATGQVTNVTLMTFARSLITTEIEQCGL